MRHLAFLFVPALKELTIRGYRLNARQPHRRVESRNAYAHDGRTFGRSQYTTGIPP
ncbi:hypothetical protein BN903_276 [Halorubrum sp. AJ67]|nr:hypothetical protein BN903_276 [Halorubrum sp. AJ67]